LAYLISVAHGRVSPDTDGTARIRIGAAPTPGRSAHSVQATEASAAAADLVRGRHRVENRGQQIG